MPKSMRRRNVEAALRSNGCVPASRSGRGPHEKWMCPCGRHTVNVPRHSNISAGVVGDLIKRMECLGKGWLQ